MNENEQHPEPGAVEDALRERDQLRAELAAAKAENERLRRRVSIEETAKDDCGESAESLKKQLAESEAECERLIQFHDDSKARWETDRNAIRNKLAAARATIAERDQRIAELEAQLGELEVDRKHRVVARDIETGNTVLIARVYGENADRDVRVFANAHETASLLEKASKTIAELEAQIAEKNS